MRKILILFLLVSFTGCATSPYITTNAVKSIDIKKYSRIAIIPFGEDVLNLRNSVSEALITEFLGMGFDVVERSQLNAVLKELKLNTSGAITVDDAKEIKKLLNIDAMLVGSVVMKSPYSVYTISLRFIDISSGEILWSSTYLNSTGDIKTTISIINTSIIEKLFGPKVEKKSTVRISENKRLQKKEFKKIAILPFAGTKYVNTEKALRGALTTELIGEDIKLVERANLEDILSEQFLEGAGLFSGPSKDDIIRSSNVPTQLYFSKDDFKRIGNLTGADGLLIGSFSPLFHSKDTIIENLVSIRLVDVETGRIAYSVSYYNDLTLAYDDIVDTSLLLSIALTPAIKNSAEDDYMGEIKSIYKRHKRGFGPAKNIFSK